MAEGKVRRLTEQTADEVIAYNLRGGGHEFTVFAETQPDRVARARALIADLLPSNSNIATIVEPGCSTGDISGYFSADHHVIGIDVTPGAAQSARERWPGMHIKEQRIEDIAPMRCDILVLCEFLEHITEPVAFAQAWLPLARYVIIGHPLVGDGNDPEPGHVWAYDLADFANWFALGGHRMMGIERFEMGPYRMALGWGEHA